MELFEKIKARRLELGLTLEDVGNIVGVGKSTVRKWETGNIADMKRDKIALLAKALKVSPLFIMGIDEEEPQPIISEKEKIILLNYNKLNDTGKNKLIEYSEDLIGNIKYMSQNTACELSATIDNKDYLMPVAAHNDNIDDEQLEKISRDIESIKRKKKK